MQGGKGSRYLKFSFVKNILRKFPGIIPQLVLAIWGKENIKRRSCPELGTRRSKY